MIVKDTVVNTKMAEIKYFSATIDLRTSMVTHPYLSYTVHFVDHSWELKSFCLETVPLFDDHIGANIGKYIAADIMTKWQLSTDKLVVKRLIMGAISSHHSITLDQQD